MAILIKRYANRKLYNTESSRYITLKGIAKLLSEGEEVRVIDNSTGEDITQVALSQILVDNQRAKEDPSDTLLSQILARGGDALYGAIRKSVDDATDGIGEFQDRFRDLVKQSESGFKNSSTFPWERGFGLGDDENDGKDAERGDAKNSASTESGAGRSRSPWSSRSQAQRGRDERESFDETVQDAMQNSVKNAVREAFEELDMPRRNDIERLSTHLKRVADALEKMQPSRTKTSPTKPDPD